MAPPGEAAKVGCACRRLWAQRLDHQRRAGRQRCAEPGRMRCAGAAIMMSSRSARVASGRRWPPGGRSDPAERFGTSSSQFRPPWPDFAVAIGRVTIPYIRKLKALAGLGTYTIILLDPQGEREDGRSVLGAGARHPSRTQRHHHAHRAAQLFGAPYCRTASRHAARDRGAAAAALCGVPGWPQRRLPIYARGVAPAGVGDAIADGARRRLDDHAVAPHAAGCRRASAER